jgi:hypothetical protein
MEKKADRIIRLVEEKIGKLFPVPDFTIEHWGIYEVPGLGRLKPEQFSEFVIKAYNSRDRFSSTHGYSFIRGKNKEPVLCEIFLNLVDGGQKVKIIESAERSIIVG